MASGRVFIDDLPLSDTVAEMNRYGLMQILMSERSLRNLRISGMFRAGEQTALVAALEEYSPIRAERRAEQQIPLTSQALFPTQDIVAR